MGADVAVEPAGADQPGHGELGADHGAAIASAFCAS
jgi:hypothetical protein